MLNVNNILGKNFLFRPEMVKFCIIKDNGKYYIKTKRDGIQLVSMTKLHHHFKKGNIIKIPENRISEFLYD